MDPLTRVMWLIACLGLAWSLFKDRTRTTRSIRTGWWHDETFSPPDHFHFVCHWLSFSMDPPGYDPHHLR